MGLSLVERANAAGASGSFSWSDIKPLLNELAGEVERLWMVERQFDAYMLSANEKFMRDGELLSERDAEIGRLKNAADSTAVTTAFRRGYQLACRHLAPVFGTLLTIEPGDSTHEDHRHGEEA